MNMSTFSKVLEHCLRTSLLAVSREIDNTDRVRCSDRFCLELIDGREGVS